MAYDTDDMMYRGYSGPSMTLEELYYFVLNMKINNADLEDFSVDYAKIAHGSIGEVHIQEASINNAMIQNLAVSRAKIEDAAINTAKIEDLSVTSGKIGNLAVTTAKIEDLAVTHAKIANAAIDTANIKVGAIKTALIAEGAIETAQIADGSITDAKIVELTANKITAGVLDVERLRITGPNSILYEINVNNVGELTASELTLDGGSITERSITADRIVADSITGREIAAKSITANHLVANTITAESGIIANGAITSAMIGNAAITSAQIESLDASKLEANSIIAGNITFKGKLEGASGTFSGTLQGGTINVTTNATIGKNLYLGATTDMTDKTIWFNSSAYIRGGTKLIMSASDILISPTTFEIGAKSTVSITGASFEVGAESYFSKKVNLSADLQAKSWLRTEGSTGWYSQTYGGGWYMTDSTWIRNYGSKSVYLNNELRVDKFSDLRGSATGDVIVRVAGYSETLRAWDKGSSTGWTYGLSTTGAFFKWWTGGRFEAKNYADTGFKDVGAQAWYTASSEKWKDDIRSPKKSGKELVNMVRIKQYHLKGTSENRHNVGMIAEESPRELRSEDGEMIDMYSMISYAYKAIQELSAEVEYLSEKLRRR